MSREISRIEQQWKDWNSLTGVEVLLHWVTFTAVNFLELEIAFKKNGITFTLITLHESSNVKLINYRLTKVELLLSSAHSNHCSRFVILMILRYNYITSSTWLKFLLSQMTAEKEDDSLKNTKTQILFIFLYAH